MKAHVAVTALTGLLLLSCADETTINNYNLGTSGMVTGSISPIEVGTIVYLDELSWYRIQADGYFYFTEVSLGEHLITVQPTSYSPRRIAGVMVAPGQATNLGTVELSDLPYPIYRTQPADGDTMVSTGTYSVAVYLDESLNLDDLVAYTTISPPVAGEWVGKVVEGRTGTRYNFAFGDPRNGDYFPLATSTTYTFKIDKSVRTVDGVALGVDAEFQFQTEPLTVYTSLPRYGANDDVPLVSFQARIQFNDSVNVDSVRKAAEFEPPVPGLWIRRASQTQADFEFLMAAPSLLPSTEYRLIIRNDVPLVRSSTLPSADTTTFTSAPIGIEYISPCNGCEGNYGSIYIEFNTPMNTASVDSAFTVSPLDGAPAPGTKSWGNDSRVMSFNPNPDLDAADVYVIRITTQARSATGVSIGRDFESYFVMR